VYTKTLNRNRLRFVTSYLLPTNIQKPSTYLIHLHFLFPILGMLVFYACADQDRFFLYVAVIAFLAVIFISRLRFIPIGSNITTPRIIMNVALAISCLYMVILVSTIGFKYFNVDIFEVYTYRRDAANALPGVFRYFSPLVAGVLVPLSLVLALYFKSAKHVILAIIVSFLCFSFTAHKGPLFNPIVIIVTFHVVRSKISMLRLVLGFLLVLVFAELLFVVSSDNIFGNLFIRRTIFVPPLLNNYYKCKYWMDWFGVYAGTHYRTRFVRCSCRTVTFFS